jgi:hypothetical protein
MRRRKVGWMLRPRRHPGRKALAYHEAGHAFVGYSMGLEIEQVTIVPGEGSLGRCRYQGWDDEEAADDLDAAMIVVLAGAVAEEIAMGAPSRGADEPRALGLALSRGISEAGAAQRIAAARLLARRFLEGHWLVVKALATALRKDRVLDGPQAVAVITRALRKSGLRPPRQKGVLPRLSSGSPQEDAIPGPVLRPLSSLRSLDLGAERIDRWGRSAPH